MDEDDVRMHGRKYELSAKQDRPDRQAEKLVEEAALRFQRFREATEQKIEHHSEMVSFYQRELKTVDRFLATNFFDRDAAKTAPEEMVLGNSRDVREPWERE